MQLSKQNKKEKVRHGGEPSVEDLKYANTNGAHIIGKISGYIPMQITSAHHFVTWASAEAETPKFVFFARGGCHTGDEVANFETIAELMSLGSLRDPRANFNSSLRKSWSSLINGSYSTAHGLTQSIPNRILSTADLELVQLFDMGHPEAFKNVGKRRLVDLVEQDFQLNREAFSDAGYSRGLRSNIYCCGHSTLPDGRVVVIGGHDMQSNNGLFRINMWDPSTESWVSRPEGIDLAYWKSSSPGENDKEYDELRDEFCGYVPPIDSVSGKRQDVHELDNPNKRIHRIAKYLGPTWTQPADASDMRYARWYPSSVVTPDNKVIVLGGDDLDEGIAPSVRVNGKIYSDRPCIYMKEDEHCDDLKQAQLDSIIDISTRGSVYQINNDIIINPATVFSGSNPQSTIKDIFGVEPKSKTLLPGGKLLEGIARDNASDIPLKQSLIQIHAPELYDPCTDRTVTMENSRMFFPLYPHLAIVETGPHKNDWQVLALDGSKDNDPNATREVIKATIKLNGYDIELKDISPFRNTWMFDLQSALKGNLNKPSSEGWNYLGEQYVTTAPYFGGAEMITLDCHGEKKSHKYYTFGGIFSGQVIPTTQVLELTPLKYGKGVQWEKLEDIPDTSIDSVDGDHEHEHDPFHKHPSRFTQTQPLPDGRIYVGFGRASNTESGETLELTNNTSALIFNPHGGPKGSWLIGPKFGNPRGIHATSTILPDGAVYTQGHDRHDLILKGDSQAPLGDSDLGVAAGQIYYPDYFFNEKDELREKPEITEHPSRITYSSNFEVTIESKHVIKGFSMIRTGSHTHESVHADIMYIKPHVRQVEGTNRYRIYTPKYPSTVMGGDYLLFALDSKGTPSVGKHVRLNEDPKKQRCECN